MKIYPNLFKGLGKMKPEHHIKLKEEISPKVRPPRKIAASLWGGEIKEELDNMEKTGVIREIGEPPEGGNSMVVVERTENLCGSRRLKQSNQMGIIST